MLMNRQRIQFFLRSFVVTTMLVLSLTSCEYNLPEPFAPELKKTYIVTEDLIVTRMTTVSSTAISLSSQRKRVRFVMTYDIYNSLNGISPELLSEPPLPDDGVVKSGSHVRVKQMFTYKYPTDRTRQGWLEFTDPDSGDKLTAYANWDVIDAKLKEVK